jgi:isoquinoline 1-oxidoreductase subunit beta
MHPNLFAKLTGTMPLAATRRGFLIGSAAVAGGFAVGLRAGPAAAQDAAAINPLDAYIRITADDRVTILSSQFEMGQGSYFGVASLVNEELGARWDQIDVVGGWGNPALFGNVAWGGATQGTGGSSSMFTSWDRYRQAGAAAREMLIAAAAAKWGVPAGEITVSEGKLTHASAGSATFGELAEAAAAMPVPSAVTLKTPEEWTIIGNADLRRNDSAPKTNGTQTFTIDVKLPGLLMAVPVHPPKFGAKVASFDATAAKAVPGVVDVVETPRGLAVIGQNTWAAMQGREALTVTWDEAGAEGRGSAEIMAEYDRVAGEAPAAVARTEGDVAAAMAGAAQVVEARYAFPYLAHAALEPLNAVARLNADGTLEIWGGHQIPDLYQAVAAQVAGITPDKVVLHVMKTGGGFGRRGVGDADVIVEAVATAMALGPDRPVRMQFTREDDMAGGRYRPAYAHAMRAGLDAGGKIVAWEHHIVGQSIVANTPFAAFIQNGVDLTSVEGASNIPYAIPALSVGLTSPTVGVPVLWWRAVGSTHTAYAVETFIDTLAAAAGTDPLEYRLAMLADKPRHAAVLRLAAEKAGWGTPAPEGRVRGIALAESFSSYVAQVAEISLEGGDLRVHKVTCAVDCGVAINPDTIRAQIEGCVGFGLGAILSEELTLTAGVVDQTNYDSYTPLRIEAMPVVEVHIVPSSEHPTGVGEPGLPPIGPAIANAIRAASGQEIRQLPILKALQAWFARGAGARCARAAGESGCRADEPKSRAVSHLNLPAAPTCRAVLLDRNSVATTRSPPRPAVRGSRAPFASLHALARASDHPLPTYPPQRLPLRIRHHGGHRPLIHRAGGVCAACRGGVGGHVFGKIDAHPVNAVKERGQTFGPDARVGQQAVGKGIGRRLGLTRVAGAEHLITDDCNQRAACRIAQHQRQDPCGPRGAEGQTRGIARLDMTDFMGKHACHFGGRACLVKKAAQDDDLPAGGGKGVDHGRIQHAQGQIITQPLPRCQPRAHHLQRRKPCGIVAGTQGVAIAQKAFHLCDHRLTKGHLAVNGHAAGQFIRDAGQKDEQDQCHGGQRATDIKCHLPPCARPQIAAGQGGGAAQPVREMAVVNGQTGRIAGAFIIGIGQQRDGERAVMRLGPGQRAHLVQGPDEPFTRWSHRRDAKIFAVSRDLHIVPHGRLPIEIDAGNGLIGARRHVRLPRPNPAHRQSLRHRRPCRPRADGSRPSHPCSPPAFQRRHA